MLVPCLTDDQMKSMTFLTLQNDAIPYQGFRTLHHTIRVHTVIIVYCTTDAYFINTITL